MNKHLVFVYGSLMSGFHNHRYLETSTQLGFEGPCRVYGFQMIDLGAFPAAVQGGVSDRIIGELYRVNSSVLIMLDQLEGVPEFYKRAQVRAEGHTAWMYYMPKPLKKTNIVPNGDWRSYVADRI